MEQSDKVCMEEENAGSNTLDLFEGDKDEVVSASEADELRLADEKALEDVAGESDKASEVGVEADALDYACVLKGSDREKCVEEVKNDSSLTPLKDLADRNAGGYYWDDGVLMQRHSDVALGVIENIIVPKSRRSDLIHLAHYKTGHLGYKKVIRIIKQNFDWPLMNRDIKTNCESCEICLKNNKGGQRKAVIVERPVLSQPFEQIALDLVGPLPKGKGGARFILTAACMATRWPEAIALKSITAKSVAESVIDICSRMGLPQQILTDRGTQFTGALAKQLTSLMG